MYAIRRHRAAVNAWYWVVNFRRRGKMYSKRFYDITCSSSKKALAKAIAWRDQQLQRAKILTVAEFHQQRRSNNRSGAPGVHFHKTPRQPRGFWQATIRFHDGKRMSKNFSVRRVGRREAFARAVAARADMLAMVEDRPYLYDAVAKRFATPGRDKNKREPKASS